MVHSQRVRVRDSYPGLRAYDFPEPPMLSNIISYVMIQYHCDIHRFESTGSVTADSGVAHPDPLSHWSAPFRIRMYKHVWHDTYRIIAV